MQTIQHPPVTDTSAGLGNLNPRNLTDAELKRYANLVAPDKLPTNWVAELVRRTSERAYTSSARN